MPSKKLLEAKKRALQEPRLTKIRELRVTLYVSLEGAAKAMGIAPSALSRIERRQGSPASRMTELAVKKYFLRMGSSEDEVRGLFTPEGYAALA